MTPDAYIDDQNLVIKLGYVVDRLDVEDRRKLFSFLLWDEETLMWFVDFIIKGMADNGDSPGREFSQRLRGLLLEHADEAVRRALAELGAAYAAQKAEIEHWRSRAWQLEMAWPYDDLPRADDGSVRQPPAEDRNRQYWMVYEDDELDLAEKIRRLVVRCELCGRESTDTQRRKLTLKIKGPNYPAEEIRRRCCRECWQKNQEREA